MTPLPMLKGWEQARVFVAIHRCFTWKPRLCRYSVGWSLWWLWFEVAKIGEQS